jgi:hypothetical protein
MLSKEPAFAGIGKKIPSKNHQLLGRYFEKSQSKNCPVLVISIPSKNRQSFMKESHGFLSGYLTFQNKSWQPWVLDQGYVSEPCV